MRERSLFPNIGCCCRRRKSLLFLRSFLPSSWFSCCIVYMAVKVLLGREGRRPCCRCITLDRVSAEAEGYLMNIAVEGRKGKRGERRKGGREGEQELRFSCSLSSGGCCIVTWRPWPHAADHWMDTYQVGSGTNVARHSTSAYDDIV